MKKKAPEPGSNLTRRRFITNAGIGVASVSGLPLMLSSCNDAGKSDNSKELLTSALGNFFSQDNIVLFQGDSITDAGRNKKNEYPNNAVSFGPGYAYIIATTLLNVLAEKNLVIHNRGISGNKVFQLDERWQKDCLDLKPDVLSILIGVNDYWHMRNGYYKGTPEIYENDYRKLLTKTRTEMPDIKLIICEPFLLADTSAVDETWLEPFSEYQKIAARIANEFEAVWVPFQAAFDNALEFAPAGHWAGDGVHPSMAGCDLMAEEWLKAVADC